MADVVKLTIVAPADQETRVVEWFLDCDLHIGGFTTVQGDGHGHAFDTASAPERVKGRTARVILMVVLPRDKASAALERVTRDLQLPRSAWWLEPVTNFGTSS